MQLSNCLLLIDYYYYSRNRHLDRLKFAAIPPPAPSRNLPLLACCQYISSCNAFKLLSAVTGTVPRIIRTPAVKGKTHQPLTDYVDALRLPRFSQQLLTSQRFFGIGFCVK